MRTAVQDDAGKQAVFNETFNQENIYEKLLNGEEMVLESYDEDVASSDLLGAT